jgi:probable rRNA maturation factor
VKKKHRIDLSCESQKFKSLRTYTSKSFSISRNEFHISLNKREAIGRLQKLLDCVLETPVSVAIRFCDTEEMRQTNLQFRKKNKPTDVLSFPASRDFPHNNAGVSLGDVLVCVPVCLAQAQKAQVSLSQELERMLVHGITHLLGFDHERSSMAQSLQETFELEMRKQLVKHLGKPQWCQVRK